MMTTVDDRIAECAIAKMPLCHNKDICTDASDRKIDVFFKRIRAIGPVVAPNVWFLQGGPGAASPAMESAMAQMFIALQGRVNVYTMDHRGTGRSTKLDCVASQATTSGSPGGTNVEPQEVPACSQELHELYGDLASFSITSAASDISRFISTETKDEPTIVYGVSYGTSLVERLIHLETPNIVGYVLDGISTASGSDVKNFEYFSTWDRDYGEIGQIFLDACTKDTDCGGKFKGKTVEEVIKALIKKMDTDASFKCGKVLTGASDETGSMGIPPSFALRQLFGGLLMDASTRPFIPVLAYRMTRCSADDVAVVRHFVNASQGMLAHDSEEDVLYTSNLLYNLIVYSDMWETPMPSEQTMLDRFTNTTISNGGTYASIAQYCAFSKEDSPTCTKYNVGNYKAKALLYKKDKYWNKAATSTESASVLLLSGKMDPQTPHKYAEYLYDAIKGEADVTKKLVTFEHATHGTLWTTPLSDDSDAPTCGMEIMTSYVKGQGQLSKLDTSCVGKMPPISFKVPDSIREALLSTNDLYDGKLQAAPGSDATSSSSSKYKTAFIVFVVLFAVAVVVAGIFAFRLRAAKKKRGVQNEEFGAELPTTPKAASYHQDNRV
ncbi:TPA: hypothetical protein N0F65_000773 [Lagenidium giganteum]|uniref:Peptidase S33 tripeptidyl aminopeptidase-like C-terminal domain-containing protein n=1 Tax=Lagenidium giganteum TaxID=4803 RepID=A0AAV2ZHQ6_9STRA|nr:TPA: hypothetical protein N0F65_000773 [Lagenidium giganteum]